MDGLSSADVLQFEGFRFDRAGGCLTRLDGPGIAEPVALGSRALDVLALLAERQGRLVTKNEIMAAVWPGTAVEEGNLTVQISTLRRVLDRDRIQGSCIQTVPGRGYRFVAPVTRGDAIATPAVPRPANGSGAPLAADDQPESRSADRRKNAVPPTPVSEAPYRLRRAVIAGAAGILCLVATIVAAVNWRSLSPWQDHSAPRLSIAVLPFTNLSNDPDQQYFADALTEDLTTDLSRIAHTFVIPSGTAFRFKTKPVDAKQIGRELGVRYVLEGSVERSGSQARVNAQLINAETNAHLWAERFDRVTADLFSLEDEITRRIAAALDAQLIAAEAARPTERPDTLDYILRGRAALLGPPTAEAYAQAIGLFERALSLDPHSIEARIRLAGALADRALTSMGGSRSSDISRAEMLIGQALEASPGDSLAHLVKATVLRARGRCAEAVPEYEAVIASDRNRANAYAALGTCKLLIGSIDETIPLEEEAIRLSPRDSKIGIRYWRIGVAHLLQSHTDEAIVWLEKATVTLPEYPIHHAYLAAGYGLKGDTERAVAELAEARRLSDGRYSSIASVKAAGHFGVPKIRALFEATYFAGLRKAGMPEE